MNAVEAHYDREPEREWERLLRHRTEFAVTCRLLAEHLPAPPGQILDVGGGPGRYALHLTRQGYRVTLLDLSRRSLDLALEMATREGVYLPPPVQGEAMALPAEDGGRYDAVLLLGPLYHLLDAADRLAAAREAWRVLRPGGTIFAAFITRFAPLRDVAIHSPQWIVDNPERFRQLLEEGLNPAYEGSGFPDSYFARPEEIAPLMESAGFVTHGLQGLEGIIAGHEETVNELEGEAWEAWVTLNARLGREPSLHGAADHLLYVGAKPGALVDAPSPP